jgi:hypothetical protein
LGLRVTDRVHVHVRASGGRSPGSRGSRLTWRALRGISLRFAPFLSGRHDLNLTGRWAIFTHQPFTSVVDGRADTQGTAQESAISVKKRVCRRGAARGGA